MNELTSIRLKLSKLLAKLSEVSTDKGTLTKPEDTEFVVGDSVFVTNEAGEYIPAPDGEYVLESGVVYVVANGSIIEIKEPVKEESLEEEVPGLTNEVSQAVEDKSEPVAIEEIRKEINELYSIVDKLVEKVTELENKVSSTETVVEKMSKVSAAKPATDDLEVVSVPQSFKEVVNNAKKNFR